MILRTLVYVLIGTTAFSNLWCVDIVGPAIYSILTSLSKSEQVKEVKPPQTYFPENSKEATLHLKAEVEPKIVELGGELRIRLIITNTTDEVQFMSLTTGCEFGYSLRDENGDIVAPTMLYECRRTTTGYKFSPGQSVEEFNWVLDDEGIKPGIYKLVVGFGPRGEWDSAPPIEIEVR